MVKLVNKNYFLLLTIIPAFANFASAQHLISFGGSVVQNANFSLSFSFGEIAINPLTNGGQNQVTQGYQQPFLIGVDEMTDTKLDFYNAISPSPSGNNDGLNDYFHIEGIEAFSDNQLTIVNRWGEIVYQVEGYNNTSIIWDGSGLNGNLLPQATYYYILTINRREKPNIFKGSVDVLYQK